MIQTTDPTSNRWKRSLPLGAGVLLVAALCGSPPVQAACSTGTTLAEGSCPSLPGPGCCASATVVQWCEGGDWCELDCAQKSEQPEESCQVNFTNSCCERCATWDSAAFCQCDEGCQAYGDCCPDYESLCAGTGSTYCSWTSSPTFTGYACGGMPQVEPTGSYPYTCDAGGAPECSCVDQECGDDGCGGSCGGCPAGSVCDFLGSCQCSGTCVGKTCGDDGCGNVCGVCDSGQFCVSGVCEGTCTPDCAGKSCGDDGCGGGCGLCASDQMCTPEGACVFGCQPECTGLVCGDDGCGGSCGSCMSGQTCSPAGQCETPCVADCLGKQCGDDGCGGSCGACPQGSCQDSLCVAGCIGDCGGKECGPDGCGGTCGGCSSDEVCGDLGACGPGCSPQCEGRSCGADGCGGSCGVCSGSAYCDPQGSCIESSAADTSVSTPDASCPEGTYWNGLVGECVADDGTHLAVNRDTGGDSGCGGSSSPPSWILVWLALVAWRSRFPGNRQAS